MKAALGEKDEERTPDNKRHKGLKEAHFRSRNTVPSGPLLSALTLIFLYPGLPSSRPSLRPCLEGPALSSCFCTNSHWAAGTDRWGLLGQQK